jgi:hypothetical protein
MKSVPVKGQTAAIGVDQGYQILYLRVEPTTIAERERNVDTIKCTSCWELDDDEIEKLMYTKKLYLVVIGSQPPVMISVNDGEA